MRKQLILTGIFSLLTTAFSTLYAQGCSMCKAVAESNVQSGGVEAAGLNDGILYMMAFPYIFLAIGAYFIRKHMRSSEVN
jgi:hypothetical protein